MNWTNGKFAGTARLGVLKTILTYFEMLRACIEVWWKALLILYIFCVAVRLSYPVFARKAFNDTNLDAPVILPYFLVITARDV